MRVLTWMFGFPATDAPRSRRAALSVASLDRRELLSIGLGYVGLATAPASEMTYLAGRFKPEAGEVEVSFLPFEFNPSKPFDNATRLVKETLPGLKGRLRLTIDLAWFAHSSGKNGKLDDGGAASVYGRQAQQAFWTAWEADRPTKEQQRIKSDFLDRVRRSDVWIKEMQTWAASKRLGGKLAFTLVPILEDECASSKAFANLVKQVRARQGTDKVGPSTIRRSMSGDHSVYFRPAGVAMELHGTWASVQGRLQAGDAWSNDGTSYGIDQFAADGETARKKKVDVLYWNSEMNGASKTQTNWSSRAIAVFSGPTAPANKARLAQVLKLE